MRPLSEVKAYVDENHHLPEIPSATEVEQNGLKLGEMNAALLKKVEELTLYIIQQKETTQKQYTKQQREIDQLKKQLKRNVK